MTKLHSVHPEKGRGHFDLCLLVILDNFIIMRPDYFIQRNEIHRMQKNIQASLFITITRQVIFLAAAFVSMLFMSKTDYHKLLKLALPGFLLSIALGILVLFLEKK